MLRNRNISTSVMVENQNYSHRTKRRLISSNVSKSSSLLSTIKDPFLEFMQEFGKVSVPVEASCLSDVGIAVARRRTERFSSPVSDIREDPFLDFLSASRNGSAWRQETSLADIGVSVAEKNFGKNGSGIIQFAYIDGPNKHLVFAFSPPGNWSEKLMNDAISNHFDFARHFSIYKYYSNGIPVTNKRGYPVRLYGLPILLLPTDEELRKIADYILGNVNLMDCRAYSYYDENRKFFTGTKFTTWSNITHVNFAFNHLLAEAQDLPHDQFYRKHIDLIYSHFPAGKFHPSFAQIIGAPSEEIDPVLLRAEEQRVPADRQFTETIFPRYFHLLDSDDDTISETEW